MQNVPRKTTVVRFVDGTLENSPRSKTTTISAAPDGSIVSVVNVTGESSVISAISMLLDSSNG